MPVVAARSATEVWYSPRTHLYTVCVYYTYKCLLWLLDCLSESASIIGVCLSLYPSLASVWVCIHHWRLSESVSIIGVCLSLHPSLASVCPRVLFLKKLSTWENARLQCVSVCACVHTSSPNVPACSTDVVTETRRWPHLCMFVCACVHTSSSNVPACWTDVVTERETWPHLCMFVCACIHTSSPNVPACWTDVVTERETWPHLCVCVFTHVYIKAKRRKYLYACVCTAATAR